MRKSIVVFLMITSLGILAFSETPSSDIFNVEGIPVTDSEAKSVDGGCPAGVVIAGLAICAGAGALSSLATQVVPSVVNGKRVEINWQSVAGGAVSGAIMGLTVTASAIATVSSAITYVGSRALAGAMGGLVSSAINQACSTPKTAPAPAKNMPLCFYTH
jgi:hypothetical protein